MPSKRKNTALLFAALLVLLAPLPPIASRVRERSDTVTISDSAIPLGGGTRVLIPTSPGTVTYQNSDTVIDASNASQGYVTVRYSGASRRAKVRITCAGKTTYTYDLASNGRYEVYPLTSGDGTYQITVYCHLHSDQYTQGLTQTIEVRLQSQLLPFLYPSQYVNFSGASRAVALGEELARGAATDLDIVAKIYNYVIGNIAYDTAKAQQVTAGQLTGYLPNVDEVLRTKRGICFDYAALMTAMLRSQQIPTRMELGYVSGGGYHAWISTYIPEIGWVNGVIHFDGVSWKLMDPTFAASAGNSSEINQYIGNGNNYWTQYVY